MFPVEWIFPVSTLIVVIGGFLLNAYRMNQIRLNDLHDLGDRLDRIESKLDQHLNYHLSKV